MARLCRAYVALQQRSDARNRALIFIFVDALLGEITLREIPEQIVDARRDQLGAIRGRVADEPRGKRRGDCADVGAIDQHEPVRVAAAGGRDFRRGA